MTQHHHPLPPQDPTPLDAEERALAARLARLGPHGEPSPALDAQVLAAAHAATTARARTAAGRRGDRERGWRRARWPVGAGIAASVALAAAIAWQMRPLPAPLAPSAESAGVSASEVSPAAPQPAAAARRAVALPSPAAQSDALAAAPAASAPADAAASIAATPAPTARDAVAAKALARPEAPPAPAEDMPESDVPPATAASPEVRDAWLARIRELAVAGRTDEARASLVEFHRRYPAFAVPEDLRPLLPQPPAP